ncbi:hypothetical protein B0H67DRAFT_288705 [Lasiosphaeris hirsuta]|uniref:Uncharacterized protein n=1 Tax=Lasiosphaeris hirsuta TaxID=260670 RepID=A0AA40A909_9PEZI|nr:hypothetical protein B0H67DRAFT_288705 [Lasiosphaeris hirsuta]
MRRLILPRNSPDPPMEFNPCPHRCPRDTWRWRQDPCPLADPIPPHILPEYRMFVVVLTSLAACFVRRDACGGTHLGHWSGENLPSILRALLSIPGIRSIRSCEATCKSSMRQPPGPRIHPRIPPPPPPPPLPGLLLPACFPTRATSFFHFYTEYSHNPLPCTALSVGGRVRSWRDRCSLSLVPERTGEPQLLTLFSNEPNPGCIGFH